MAGTIEISAPGRHARRQPSRISDVFVAQKNIDVLPNLPLFGYDAVPHARTRRPQRLQCLEQRGALGLKFHRAASAGEGPQWARNVKRDHRRLPRPFLLLPLAVLDLELTGAATRFPLRLPRGSPITALFTHTTDGSPSSIFFHVLPSSLEP